MVYIDVYDMYDIYDMYIDHLKLDMLGMHDIYIQLDTKSYIS